MGFSGEYVRKRQQKSAAAAAAQKQDPPAQQEEEKQQHESTPASSLPRQAQSILGLLLGIIVMIPLFLLLRYNAITPCGALSKAVYKDLQRRATQEGGAPGEALGRLIGIRTSFFLVQFQINSLNPGQCVSQLIRLELAGENPYASTSKK